MRLSLRGWISLVGGVVWTVVAVAAGQADLVPVGLFLVVLPLLSVIAMIPSRLRLRAVRWLPEEPVPTGSPLAWHVGVEAGGFNPAGVGELTERLDPALGPNVTVGFGQGMRARRVTAELRTTALWRGRHSVGPARIVLRHALGFAAVARTTADTGTVVVTPPVSPLGPARDGRALADGAQVPLGRAGVTSLDDATIRDYVDGDDIRRIHWRSTARLGALMVRREDATWDPRARVVLDTRSSAFGAARPDPRFEAMVGLAASIAVHLVHAGYAVSLADTHGALHALDASPLVAHSEALLWLADVQTVDNGLTLAPDVGRSGDVVIAILATLSADDALTLTGATRGGLAVLMGAEPPDETVAEAFADAGWRLVPVDADTPPAVAWQALTGGRP